MPKPRNIRKKQIESEDEQEIPDQAGSPSQVSETIEELQELRKLRRKHGGINTEKLLKGTEKKKKKKTSNEPWGLHTLDAVRRGNEDEEGTEKKLKLDTFTTQTNALDVDKHMMAYIEEQMRKRRGEVAERAEEEKKARNHGPIDIYEELYRIPDRLKLDQKRVEEGSVQLSTQMLTAIPEVDLGIDVRLKNIEETERAKRKYMDEEAAKSDRSEDEGDEVPANYEKQIVKEHKHRLDRRQMASDEIVAERFKKRMRK
ncbi:hepatocellular carcinoma-associated antigen 59-domain-containing protein [Dichotomocladium elegans]|nr:hepatocellular carcinoma-associated antigen 59-domain-containing protein [Dichotomocladium elegans]